MSSGGAIGVLFKGEYLRSSSNAGLISCNALQNENGLVKNKVIAIKDIGRVCYPHDSRKAHRSIEKIEVAFA